MTEHNNPLGMKFRQRIADWAKPVNHVASDGAGTCAAFASLMPEAAALLEGAALSAPADVKRTGMTLPKLIVVVGPTPPARARQVSCR